jgi:hypothetical protein
LSSSARAVPTTRARLAAGTARRGSSHPDAQRLREADADLGLVAAAQPAPGVERWVLEAGVVAGEGHELDRLAEREESAPWAT